jgi:uncharacterized protein YceK
MKQRLFLMCMIVPLLSGCVSGTHLTRVANPGHFAGKYPFEAVAVDIASLSGDANPILDVGVWGLLSLPLDIVIDAVLSPADLILWPFGVEK